MKNLNHTINKLNEKDKYRTLNSTAAEYIIFKYKILMTVHNTSFNKF